MRGVSVQLLVVLTGLAGYLGPATATFGADKTAEECEAEGTPLRSALLAGEVEPYAWSGAPKECNTAGCTHPHWGPYCRFEFQPHCPLELRQELTSWLRRWSVEGAAWAEQALLQRPCNLWPLLKGRTLWVAGDSMSQETAYTVTCFLLEYMLPDNFTRDPRGPLPVYSESIIESLEEDVHNKRLAYWCKAFQGETRVCYLNADKGPRLAHVLRLLPQLASTEDVLIMNLGIHYNDIKALKQDLEFIAEAVADKQHELPRQIYWKETTPQHYNQSHGMMDERRPLVEQTCHPPGEAHGVNITIFKDGSVGPEPGPTHPAAGSHNMMLQKLLAGGHRNSASKPIIASLGIKSLPLWNLTLTLWRFHQHIHARGMGGTCEDVSCDCTHTCVPSWGQMALAGLQNLLTEDSSDAGELRLQQQSEHWRDAVSTTSGLPWEAIYDSRQAASNEGGTPHVQGGVQSPPDVSGEWS